MNVFGQRERSWRKARKRAVSPIIATILLVAITVVLAAVLYVLISGLTHGTGSAPLGTNFSWGTPVNSTGQTSGTGCGAIGTAPANAFCYSIEIAGSSVTTSNFILALRNSAGATVAWPNGGTGTTVKTCTTTTGCEASPSTSQIVLISPTVSTPVASYSTTAASWSLATTFSGTVSGGFSIVLYLVGASGAGAGLFGYELVAIGASGYSGSVPSNAFS
jgi:flagellin-like protein